MYRHPSRPRKNWRRKVEEQGLTYAVDRAENGDERPYWHEAAMYEVSEEEVEYLEQTTEELHDMAVQAARRMVDDPELIARLGLPPGAADLVRASLLGSGSSITLYGRFDLAYDGTGPAKLLEYNADTPAGLVEAAVTQWYWLEDMMPDYDQWNMLHERLVQAWTRYAGDPGIPDEVVHFAVGAARRGLAQWREVSGLERAEIFHEVSRVLKEHADELAALMTREGGKPYVENHDEVGWAAACFDYYCEIARDHVGYLPAPIEPQQLALVVKEPVASSLASSPGTTRCSSPPGRWRRLWPRATPSYGSPPKRRRWPVGAWPSS